MTDTETLNEDTTPTRASEGGDNPITGFLMQFQRLSAKERTGEAFARLLAEAVGCSHIMILAYDPDEATLYYHSAYPIPPKTTEIDINTFNTDEESLIPRIMSGDLVTYNTQSDETRLASLSAAVPAQHMSLLALHADTRPIGVLALYNEPDKPLTKAQQTTLLALQPILSSLLEWIREQTILKTRIEEIERESEIFSRIDEELNDTIEINYVFTMMKDWALRFTNADAAALALYDANTDAVRIMSQYGFKPNSITIDEELPQEHSGIMLRVARRGSPEVVPNVTTDPDYYALADGMLTQMSVPIKREDKVIGVLTLLGREINSFTDEHLEFSKRLSNRAGVAVDNARLFMVTKREREKLSNILRNIADNVIVVNLDHKIELINSSTILAFHLSADEHYEGRTLTDIITHAKLQIAYQDAVENNDTVTTELNLPNGRTYHTSIEFHAGIGHIIVMQDITHFKETDRLKTELVATVSHDLKQPLSVMRGYLDLLKMVNEFDEKSMRYVDNLNFAFASMQQLIDDLLDIARIEAGIKLEMEEVNLLDVLARSVRSNTQQSDMKSIKLTLDLPENLPVIQGDPKRLEQVFNNLVSNAVKYTQPEGDVTISAEVRQNTLRVSVKDNGMGIGAEDQAQIFERFYRVRRPETDSIEGTGLGLAIVKSLVEAHDGKIDLKSVLGSGSTFRVTLPIS
ncbi:MAG: ATP-binding protein [Anaerolineae bacterium]